VRLIFRSKTNQATIADRCILRRASEVAGELSTGRCGPPHNYSVVAPTARKNCLSGAKRLLQHYPDQSGHARCSGRLPKMTHTDRFARATTATNGRFEEFRQQLSAIIRWHPPNVIDCRRSAQEGSTIRLSSCVGGYGIMAWRVCLGPDDICLSDLEPLFVCIRWSA